MYTAFLLAIIATTIEASVCLISTRQLWRMKAGAYDRSRWLLGIGALTTGLLAAFGLVVSIAFSGVDTPPPMLQPWIGLVYLSTHIIMTLYPISVVDPNWFNSKRFFFLFLPIAVLFAANLFFVGRWTPLSSPSDIWENALKPDVLVRLAGLFVMLPYCLILLILPYNYRHSSASFWWILNYSFGLIALCGVHISFMLTYNPVLLIIMPLLAAAFYLFSTEYELEDRLVPIKEAPEKEMPEKEVPEKIAVPSSQVPDIEEALETGLDGTAPEFGLWTRIGIAMDKEEVWRDPDLSLTAMARLCGTNVTYLNRIIHEETGSSFKDLVNSKRIQNVATRLKEDASVDIQDAFFAAGYRSRATAWRNFKEIMGVTPTEFRQRLK